MFTSNSVRFLLFNAALVATTTTVNAQRFPIPLTNECNPCVDLGDVPLSDECVASNEIVAAIIAADSGCGRKWDPFCIVEYNDCYNNACGPSQQALIDSIANTGGPLDRPINREQIRKDCLATPSPSPMPSPAPSRNPTKNPTKNPTNPPTNPPTNNPTKNPTQPPTPGPTPPPSPPPSPGPTPPPSPPPTPSPTLPPSPGPTPPPSPPPSPGPTPPPSPPPTPSPTLPPSPGPTPPPSPPPSPGPTPPPSPPPTPSPTLPPSPGPTPPPSPPPTLPPTPPPSPGPTPPPTLPPTPGPTPPPTLPPTPGPTPAPSLTPTYTCDISTCVNCTAVINGDELSCDEILPEQKTSCNCPDCVRNLKFVYTGKNCPPNQKASGQCTDFGPNPFIAGYRITNSDDDTQVLSTGSVEQGDMVTITPSPSGCIPDKLVVTISVPTGAATQTFIIDSTCDGGRGLLLTESYGAFESTGYSCDEFDVHDCLQTVNYGLKVCNDGFTDETIYDWFLKANDDYCDLLENVNPQDVMLSPGECYYDTKPYVVDRCMSANYCVDVTANATNPLTGIPEDCPGTDQLKFNWTSIPTLPPTPAPRYV